MNLFQDFKNRLSEVVETLAEDGRLPDGLDMQRVSSEPPREPGHGDITTNVAMVFAKSAGKNPCELAEVLSEPLRQLASVETVEIAGPGFINVRLSSEFWQARLADVIAFGPAYGDSKMGKGVRVNVEYVSANPTGPLHVAHARGAVVGDALANLLHKAGYNVATEYYINDAGAQVDMLARSAYVRYRQALGEDIGPFPEDLYPGDYLIPVGEAIAEQDGDQWLGVDEREWLPEFRSFAVDRMMALVREDLKALAVEHEVFTSERSLVESGRVEEVYETLEEKGLIYEGVLEPPKGKLPDDWEPRPQKLFRATEFGDDVDRPLKKSDGSWTYFTNDIAYHLDKYRRGFKSMIDIFGADHGGYVKRMVAATKAISDGEADLDIKLCQIVHLLKGGEPMRMSKRAGTFVTLRELVDEVGKDVVRFIMLTRKNDTQMEFDLEKALEESRENPVFYVQYAHARCRSVLRNAAEEFGAVELSAESLGKGPLHLLTDPAEQDLIKCMANWPRVVENAAEAHEPHRIAYYLNDLATLFHALWNKGKDEARLRFIIAEERDLTLARLALVQGVAFVIASGLRVFGVTPVEELR